MLHFRGEYFIACVFPSQKRVAVCDLKYHTPEKVNLGNCGDFFIVFQYNSSKYLSLSSLLLTKKIFFKELSLDSLQYICLWGPLPGMILIVFIFFLVAILILGHPGICHGSRVR